MRDERYEKPATENDKPSGTGSATGFLAGFGFGGLSTTPIESCTTYNSLDVNQSYICLLMYILKTCLTLFIYLNQGNTTDLCHLYAISLIIDN